MWKLEVISTPLLWHSLEEKGFSRKCDCRTGLSFGTYFRVGLMLKYYEITCFVLILLNREAANIMPPSLCVILLVLA